VNEWRIEYSYGPESPRVTWAVANMDPPAEVFWCCMLVLTDLQERHPDARVYVNGKLFTPTEEQVDDYKAHLEGIVSGEKIPLPALDPRDIWKYASDTKDFLDSARKLEVPHVPARRRGDAEAAAVPVHLQKVRIRRRPGPASGGA